MKKLFLIFLVPCIVHAQTNTFPSNGGVGIGTLSPRKNLETVGVGIFSSSTSGSGIIIDGSQLPSTNNWSSVQLTAGGDGGSAYLKTSLSNWGGYFNWTRGSSTGDVEIMRINASNGNVGIGTANPQARFHVVSGQIIETTGTSSNERTLTLLNAGTGQMNLAYYNGPWRSAIQIQNNNATKALFFAPPESDYNYSILRSVNGGIKLDVGGTASDVGTNAITIETNGNIGINTAPFSQYKLAVNGDAIFTKVKVKTYSTWPDYVFHRSYKLLPIKELENYIKRNNHLPDIPSADAVKKNGLDLGDNQATLLRKIEELTLYIIEQDKKIDAQNKQLDFQQKQITQLFELKKDLEAVKSKLQTN